MRMISGRKGFTLIEILLVVVIIGIMLAVIVPRAWRANVDAKYGLVRQACSELASFGTEWAEQQIVAQQEYDTATMENYVISLSMDNLGDWLPDEDKNWHGFSEVIGRDEDPATNVQGIVPPEKHPRNPFNGASYFTEANNTMTPGAIACFIADDEATLDIQGLRNGVFFFKGSYAAFVWSGTDSTEEAPLYAGQNMYGGGDGGTPFD